MKINHLLTLFVLFFISHNSKAALLHQHAITHPQSVLLDATTAKALQVFILAEDKKLNLAVAYMTPEQVQKLVAYNHSIGKCGGFEALSEEESLNPNLILSDFTKTQIAFDSLNLRIYETLEFKNEYQQLADLADPVSLEKTINWFTSYPNRYNKAPEPNRHVDDLARSLENELHDAPWEYVVEKIEHRSTRQKTVKVTIKGQTKPQEVIVIGGHFDSINSSFFGGSDKAPGADDNASGSANVLEALRILKNWKKFDRTIEFYWYAGEESGLLGSAEIATAAKSANKDVIAVLQLDMTLYPGSGDNVVGLVTDFTSPWLRSVFTQINDLYVKTRLVPDECGYGCSDHASWHRQGFHAVTPFEATTETMNRNIHTDKDIIDQRSSLSHSNKFTKFATLFALVLGNSNLRP